MLKTSGGFRGGGEPALAPSPFGRRTDAITILLISGDGTVLWRRHRPVISRLHRRINHYLSLQTRPAKTTLSHNAEIGLV